ncbi:MAG: peptide chain release factor 2 [Firmicutes bacterium]|nr:peptide chain release factor 2 [Bacillota bacterium]
MLGGLFDINSLLNEKEDLDKKVNAEGFWNDTDNANKILKDLKQINKIIYDYNTIKDNIDISIELASINELDINEYNNIVKSVEELEFNTLLNGEYDNYNCYLEIHPGAGGIESCDWASMLLRMYQRFFDRNDYKYSVIDMQDGDEAGIKSVTLKVEGDYAYGYLKNEKGVHRLVRISPFDSNKRRHTSFASVNITPIFDNNIEIDLRDEDLKIDVYHSSGAGGQSVNTANSAVRITHLPTKTVVTCQNERSQLRNKEVAMQLLKNKLYQLKLEEQEKELKNITGSVSNIDFGSQIRSYVLEPYKLVKDHRSKFENTDPLKVLDGDIKTLIESILKLK